LDNADRAPPGLTQDDADDTSGTHADRYKTGVENSEVLLFGSVAMPVTKWALTGAEVAIKTENGSERSRSDLFTAANVKLYDPCFPRSRAAVERSAVGRRFKPDAQGVVAWAAESEAALLAQVAEKLGDFSASCGRRGDCGRRIIELLELSNGEKRPLGTTMTQQFGGTVTARKREKTLVFPSISPAGRWSAERPRRFDRFVPAPHKPYKKSCSRGSSAA
jgi:hypothetical protein